MTWEEAGLNTEDIAIKAALTFLASVNVPVAKLKAIKGILDAQEFNLNEVYTAEFHVPAGSIVSEAITFLEDNNFLVYKKHCGRAVVK